MRSAVEMILNAFLSRQSADQQNRLVCYLPEDEQKSLKQLPAFTESLKVERFTNGAVLKGVHWSWFLPTLKSYSPKDQTLFLSALEENEALALAAEIPCKAPSIPLANIGKAYLRQFLLDSLIGEHDRLIPIDYLPPSPLNQLLQLSKKQLTDRIDLLAMHDLAVEIRQIVETKTLKKIYSFLTDAQRKFLKLTTAKHELITQPKIGLDRWDGNKDSLRHLLHRRGLARLGLALSGQDPSLMWYVCHILDIGRGDSLFKLSEQEVSSIAARETAVRQVVELLGNEL